MIDFGEIRIRLPKGLLAALEFLPVLILLATGLVVLSAFLGVVRWLVGGGR